MQRNNLFRVNSLLSAMVLGAVLGTSGCTMIKSAQALQPLDWIDHRTENLPVTGVGGFSRLRNKPVMVGPFTANIQSQSPWGSLSTSTTDNTTVTIGDASKDGKELRDGTNKTNRDAELSYQLSGTSGVLTNIRCRQVLRMQTKDTGVTRADGSNVFTMKSLDSYNSTFSCRSGQASTAWPRWQMDLSNEPDEPLAGSLAIDGVRYTVTGSQASTIGAVGTTVSYTIAQGDQTLALIDRSGEGMVSLRQNLSAKQRVAAIAASVALLLANDPLYE